MFTRLLITAAAILAISPLHAEESALTAQEFRMMTQGKTLYFADPAGTYGAEQYLGDNRVRWSFLDGQCKEGRWYAAGPMICFIYGEDPTPDCWRFFAKDGDIRAKYQHPPNAGLDYKIQIETRPLSCGGALAGV